MAQILWDAVGHRTLEMTPHELIRVEFGSVSGEAVGVQPGVSLQEDRDQLPFVGCPGVPQQDHGPSQVPAQLLQERHHLGGADVLVGIEPCIQRESLPPGRHADGRDRRDFRPVPGDAQSRGLPARSPGADHAGDEQEATLVEKDQVGAEPFSLFLYAAIGTVSSGRWPARSAPGLASPASGSSSLSRSETATDGWGGSAPQTPAELPGPPGAGSTGRSRTHAPRPPSAGDALRLAAAEASAWEVAPAQAWPGAPPLRACDRRGAIRTLSLPNSLPALPLPTRSVPAVAAQGRVGGASPAASGCHRVACSQDSIFSITFA